MPDCIYKDKNRSRYGMQEGKHEAKTVLQEQFKSYNSIFTLVVSEMWTKELKTTAKTRT